jgi:hypothetical protein
MRKKIHLCDSPLKKPCKPNQHNERNKPDNPNHFDPNYFDITLSMPEWQNALGEAVVQGTFSKLVQIEIGK